ncbi:MAG: TMEM165/GDT1 family protein [bacterium]
MSISSTSFLLIFAAEIGDKSQLVCMTLAARYSAVPVMLGSGLAFLVLNTLAVVFGAAVANWIPEVFVSGMVAVLFAAFGIHALRVGEATDEQDIDIASRRGIFFTTFLLIVVAEFGDKTQLAVVALSSASIPSAVWLGATLALVTTSVLGVWLGSTLLLRMSITSLHRISGVIFLMLAVIASYKTFESF